MILYLNTQKISPKDELL